MARLALLLDEEEGHLYSTFKLARELAHHGHDIWYFGHSASEGLVDKHGFKFRAVYDSVGSYQKTVNAFPWLPLNRRALDSLTTAFHAINPDLFITLSMFCPEALVLMLTCKTPVVLIRNHFNPLPRKRCYREIVTLKLMASSVTSVQLIQALRSCGLVTIDSDKLAQLAIDHIPEVVLLPRELAFRHLEDEWMTYAGFMVDTERPKDVSFPWDSIPSGRKLVYCSFGSHAFLESALTHHFYRLLIDTMGECPDISLLLSTGRALASTNTRLPPNVYVTDWAPQIEVLDHVDLMLNHGGIGSVKECLVKGVPMVVLPLMRDQFSCADRLVQLGLALRGDIRTVTIGTLKNLIEAGLASDTMRSATNSMRLQCGVDDNTGVISLVDKSIAEVKRMQIGSSLLYN